MQEPDPESGLPIGTPPAQPPEPAAGQAGAGGTPSQGPAHGITSPDSGDPRVPVSQQCAASAHIAAAGQPSGRLEIRICGPLAEKTSLFETVGSVIGIIVCV